MSAPKLPRALDELLAIGGLDVAEVRLARRVAHDVHPERFIAVLDRARLKTQPRFVMSSVMTAIYIADADLATITRLCEREGWGEPLLIVKAALGEIDRLHA